MTLQQGGNGGYQLRQRGAQRHHGDTHHLGGNAQPILCQRDGRALQHIGAHRNQRGTDDQHDQILYQRAAVVIRLTLGLRGGILESVADGQEHIHGKNQQHHNAQPSVETTEDVSGGHVNGGGNEEENDRCYHCLTIDRCGTDGDGQSGNQRRITDDGADGVAIGHGGIVVHRGSDRYHYLRQGGADGHHRGADDNLGHAEFLGHAHGAVHKPVAALNQQQHAHGKQRQRPPQGAGQAVVPCKKCIEHDSFSSL